MVHAPEVTDYIKRQATKLDAVSDDIDAVKVDAAVAAAEEAKKQAMFDDASVFDSEKDKAAFRQYEAACDRVKNFYAVSGGDSSWLCFLVLGESRTSQRIVVARGMMSVGEACLPSRCHRPRAGFTGAGTSRAVPVLFT
jgi:hypothetical protein